MGLSRQEYWSGLPCPPPGGLPDPGIELESPTLAGTLSHLGSPGQGGTTDNLKRVYLSHASLMEGRGVNGVGVEMMEKFQTMWL